MEVTIFIEQGDLEHYLRVYGAPTSFKISHNSFRSFGIVFIPYFDPETEESSFARCAGRMFGQEVLWNDDLSHNHKLTLYDVIFVMILVY